MNPNNKIPPLKRVSHKFKLNQKDIKYRCVHKAYFQMS